MPVVQIERGALPWNPDRASTVTAEYRYHDHPLDGVLQQSDSLFRFMCLDGAGDNGVSWWLYCQTTTAELDDLESAETLEDFHTRWTAGIPAPCVVALALDSVIVDYREVTEGGTQAAKEAVKELYEQLQDSAAEAREPAFV